MVSLYDQPVLARLRPRAAPRPLREGEPEPGFEAGGGTPSGPACEVVGTSGALRAALAHADRVAATDSPVLLLGETGTGKELVARRIHEAGRRRARPLVALNCAALPAGLVESELFGYERGAFTGALRTTPGRFEAAQGGTLLLDEIGELPPETQPKLLRALETGEIQRLGSARTIRVDVRIVAATNRDLVREISAGRFRADLYYRLSVFPVTLPPLRERHGDVPLLVWYFIERKQRDLGRCVRRVPDAFMRALESYAWPGNVRELENVIERALILTRGDTLATDWLPPGLDPPLEAPDATLAEMERRHIRAVLERCGWKVSGPGNAAERLGITRSTLQFRMKRLGIVRPARGV